jgi:glycerol-1-phosphate dehydrogenase [NAD(P)+]
MQALFEALVFSGCAMTLQGSSLPASGGEHLVSHTLDMMSHQDGRPHDLHGRQVGVATLFVAELYQRMMRVDEPSFSPAVPPFDAALWGSIGPAVHAELLRKRDRMEQTCRALARPGSWEALRRELMPRLRDPGAIKSCLKRAGGAHRIEDLGCSRERFLTAVRNCSVIRARFTSIDLANAMGLLPGCAEEIVEQWLV